MARRFDIKGERGAALVEFALVLPIFIVLLVGVLEFGTLFNYWIDETHLANEGARWAVVNNVPGGGNLQQYIRSQADSSDLQSNAHVCVSFPSGTSNVGDPVQVQVSYDSGIPVVSGVVNKFFGGSLPSTVKLKGTSTMRLEALPTSYTSGDGGTGAC
jgi:Flp pilus assembly protein TadG